MNINKIRNIGYPDRSTIHPPNKGNMAGRILPAPAIPAYRALFSVPDISSNTPFMDIKYMETITPPVKKINKNGGVPGNNRRTNRTDTTRNTLP